MATIKEEVKKMLDEEKARAVAAIREAEQSSTKIYMFQSQTDKLEQ